MKCVRLCVVPVLVTIVSSLGGAASAMASTHAIPSNHRASVARRHAPAGGSGAMKLIVVRTHAGSVVATTAVGIGARFGRDSLFGSLLGAAKGCVEGAVNGPLLPGGVYVQKIGGKVLSVVLPEGRVAGCVEGAIKNVLGL